jgi:hypothetical protein
MCCVTHPYRDQLARAQAAHLGQSAFVESLMAPSDDWRCRCALTTEPCQRRATGEDLNCDWCRETDHAAWARANLPVSLGGYADVPRDYGEYAREQSLAYSADFYQAGDFLSGFEASQAGPSSFQFEIPPGDLPPLSGMTTSAVGQLTPAEIKSVLGLPKL